MDIGALFHCLPPHLTATTLRQCSRMAWAMLVMTGRVTMRGLSRWAGQGGSYRTVQRFFAPALPWAILVWGFFRPQGYRPQEVYVLAGAAVVAPKAGTPPPGLDRCVARLYGQPVAGLAGCTWSLVSPPARRSCPVRVEQVVRRAAEQAATRAKVAAQQRKPSPAKRRPGRPQGSTHTPNADATRTPELWRLTGLLAGWRHLLARVVPLTSCVLDGHCGNHQARPMARQRPRHLSAKRRCRPVLPLRRPLCRAGATSPVWPEGG